MYDITKIYSFPLSNFTISLWYTLFGMGHAVTLFKICSTCFLFKLERGLLWWSIQNKESLLFQKVPYVCWNKSSSKYMLKYAKLGCELKSTNYSTVD
jgi:hypothetical protein